MTWTSETRPTCSVDPFEERTRPCLVARRVSQDLPVATFIAREQIGCRCACSHVSSSRHVPVFIGNDGWVRSNAWTWAFVGSRTPPRSGGLRYRPTTSTSFSSNRGSFVTLNVSTFHGLKSWSPQIWPPRPSDTQPRRQRAGAPLRGPIGRARVVLSRSTSSTVPLGRLGLRPRPLAIFPRPPGPAQRSENASAAPYPSPPRSGGRSSSFAHPGACHQQPRACTTPCRCGSDVDDAVRLRHHSLLMGAAPIPLQSSPARFTQTRTISQTLHSE